MNSLSMQRQSAPVRTTRHAGGAAAPRLPARLQQQHTGRAAAPPSSSSSSCVAAGAAAEQRPSAASAAPPADEPVASSSSRFEDAAAAPASAATAGTTSLALALAALALASPPAALADATAAAVAVSEGAGTPFQSVQANSLYVTLALFLMSVPGIWSQVKRAPKSKIKRVTFEVAGPRSTLVAPVTLDDHARAVFRYFKRYNYEVESSGEVITFAGVYAADRGQAAAVTLYTFFGMGSVALVLATLFPGSGNSWYGLTALSPLAAVYYFRNGERREEVRVKMVAADDEATADVVVEGDADEIERLARELGFVEKGKVRVKGLLEQA